MPMETFEDPGFNSMYVDVAMRCCEYFLAGSLSHHMHPIRMTFNFSGALNLNSLKRWNGYIFCVPTSPVLFAKSKETSLCFSSAWTCLAITAGRWGPFHFSSSLIISFTGIFLKISSLIIVPTWTRTLSTNLLSFMASIKTTCLYALTPGILSWTYTYTLYSTSISTFPPLTECHLHFELVVLKILQMILC